VFAIAKSQFIFINGMWRRKTITSRAAWVQFDGAPVSGVDVDATLALFDPLEDEGPVAVVFLPMLGTKILEAQMC